MREGERGILCQAHPATPADLDWIFQLEIDAYCAQYAVARRTLEQWYGSNPDGFTILTINGSKVGHLTLIPLRPEILKGFIEGTVLEQDIQAASLYTPRERQLIKNLYVESIIVDAHAGPSTLPIKALTRLAHDFLSLIRRVCDPINLENVYALAASGRGERFMNGLGFYQVRSGQERADNRALYVAEFGTLSANISELYERRMTKRLNREVQNVVD